MRPRGTIAILESVHPLVADAFRKAGYDVRDAVDVSAHAILTGELKSVHGLIVRSRFIINAELLAAMPELRFIGRSGSGLENIDIEACAARNVAVFNSPEGNSDAVGEHVVGMMLSLLHKLREADLSVRSGQWAREAHRGRELKHQVVGIIGFGHMGRAVARRLQGFDCRVLAYDKYKTGFDGHLGVEEASEDQIRAHANLLTLHIPLTTETEGMVDYQWLCGFERRPLVLVNAARGPVASTAGIWQAMQESVLEAVALDVLESEGRDLLGVQPSSEPLQRLFAHPRTLFSPHVAGWTVESHEKLGRVLVDKILAFESTR